MLYRPVMARLCGPDKVRVPNIRLFRQVLLSASLRLQTHLEPLADTRAELLFADILRFGRLLDLESMFICACCKDDFAVGIPQAGKSAQNVRKNHRVEVADMGGCNELLG